ncbi:DUF6396 domain-containing protein [Pseudomonas sp. 148P]|uniref:DUF6396 domain-containing protein n=1 Tax=Pseudomonas ulcerans TaxID=3115852 RepID=A0ABU7HQG4_9PSED|nr:MULTISPECIES: DUF6396 domain-containing protein [unclassified Pseudomonas]MEE1922772.1 DUF6396 domain-containing protein [Pseudomonas sp. 147P]MEE1933749.1 DUF6396 domain-containing protein [Pseudomonas sp. 148P]
MNGMEKTDKKIDFNCRSERFPVVSPESDVLYLYARWLQKNNILRMDLNVNSNIERLYRVAAEHGHSKANVNLQNGSIRGELNLRGSEHLRFSESLIEAGVASGYNFIAIFLDHGFAGLEKNEELALRYYRKAADEGSSSAQEYVANKIYPINVAPDVAMKMRLCAAGQGNGNAAVAAAIRYQGLKDYDSALKYSQIGVAAGDESSAYGLWQAFRNPDPNDELNYLGQQEDLERAQRYEKIWEILANYSYANPKVPEINEIVPLPPAKLPPWDGKLQWLEERLANVPPPKPEEWLIEKLAKEKGLDPATGRPMPGSPAFKAEYFPADTCNSSDPCPQEGYWKVMWPERWVRNEEVIQHFNEGDLMPHPEGNYYLHRIWPLPRKLVRGPIYVKWGLLG